MPNKKTHKTTHQIHTEIHTILIRLRETRAALGALGLTLLIGFGFWVKDSAPFQGSILRWISPQTAEDTIITFGKTELEFQKDEIIITPLGQSGKISYYQANHYLTGNTLRSYFFALTLDDQGTWHILEYEPLH